MSIVAAVCLALLTQTPQAEPPMPKGLIEGSKLQADFNAAKNQVRLMFIFSPS